MAGSPAKALHNPLIFYTHISNVVQLGAQSLLWLSSGQGVGVGASLGLCPSLWPTSVSLQAPGPTGYSESPRGYCPAQGSESGLASLLLPYPACLPGPSAHTFVLGGLPHWLTDLPGRLGHSMQGPGGTDLGLMALAMSSFLGPALKVRLEPLNTWASGLFCCAILATTPDRCHQG